MPLVKLTPESQPSVNKNIGYHNNIFHASRVYATPTCHQQASVASTRAPPDAKKSSISIRNFFTCSTSLARKTSKFRPRVLCKHKAAPLSFYCLAIVSSQSAMFQWNGPPINDLFQRPQSPECRRRLQPHHTRKGPVGTPLLKMTMSNKYYTTIPSRIRDTVDRKGNVTRHTPFFEKTLSQVRDKFLKGTPEDEMWNVLTMVQNIEFMLLSEGGNNTASHVDDFAPVIFITCHRGPVGIGWIPLTWQDRLKWEHDPTSVKRQARYLVLHPGQTVYMPPGTIHSVFRKHGVPILITGGEVLTWAGLRRWPCLLKHQELCETEPDVTPDSAEKWVACLFEVVRQRREAQDWDMLDSAQNVWIITSSSQPEHISSAQSTDLNPM
ncbi:uncharacterized protein BKA55DRAFT_546266 [Fusarium redolens]|uniref:JmjC domain-containing protein n=1 Tax=Fusarium redolens TaxID=48865 RepID=A0A9P9FXZ4_FUSRE|nr:uncharacterized protein BKA55DRAFT_546266 [Fusarium redolens]KAH7220486.1 hypothetical protein BKA55DRAFT_546266 [Fusarium redolens]